MSESVVSQELRTISYDGVVVGVQLDINIMIRIYMRSASPQKFGIRVIKELPDTLRNEDVKRALDIPEFDSVIIREASHSPLEADLTLIKNRKRVAEFSVKATPTGNLEYVVKSWRSERRDLDLLAIIHLEGRKDGKDLFFVALIVVPKTLRVYKASQIKQFLLNVIDAKRISEGLDRLWPTDFTELANAIRDLKIIRIARAVEKLTKQQEELSNKFDRLISTQETITKQQKELSDKFDQFLNTQETITKQQKELSDKLDRLLELLLKIYKASSKEKENS